MRFKDKKAHTELIRARTRLLVGSPFFGCLSMHLELVEVNDQAMCSTMGVDGKHLYYYPPFVLSLTEDELKGVMAHEVFHCVYKHMTRRGGRDPRLYNCAGDFVINLDVIEAGFKLPGPPITMDSPPGVKGHLYDVQFKGMSTEEVYSRLLDHLKKMIADGKVTVISVGNGKGDNKGNGKGDDDQQGNNGAGHHDPSGCGGVWDASPNADKATKDAVDREWEITVREAVAVARANSAGPLPGYLQRLADILKKPQVDWRERTRQFIDASMSKDYSWSKPNRRYINQDLYLPGFVADALHHMVFIADVSGSINHEIMCSYGGEVAGALDDGVADRLTVIYADTHVRKVDEYLPGDIVRLETPGGGGTRFDDSFRWVMENAPDAACVVYLTDMMPEPDGWGEDPGIPVLWACYVPTPMFKQLRPPFGEMIHVDGAD